MSLSVQTGHPRYYNQLYSGRDPAGMLAGLAVEMLNTNVYGIISFIINMLLGVACVVSGMGVCASSILRHLINDHVLICIH